MRHLQGNGLPATVQAKEHLPVLPGLGLLMRAKVLLIAALAAIAAYLTFATSMGAPVRFFIETQLLPYGPCPKGDFVAYGWIDHPVATPGSRIIFGQTLYGTCAASLTITGG